MIRNTGVVCSCYRAFGLASLIIICLVLGQWGVIPRSASAGGDMTNTHSAEIRETAASDEADKKIAARVNGAEISMNSVLAMMYRINAKKIRSGEAIDPPEEVKKEALRRLIFQELAYQSAKAEGLKADEAALTAEINNFRKKMGGEEKFREFLEKAGMTEEALRDSAEKKIVLEAIADKKVRAGIAVSEEDLKKAYEKDKDTYETPEKILITNVVFFLKIDDEASMKKAESVLAAIKADKNTNPWKLESDDSFVIRDLEVKQEEEPELYAASKNLKTGELSGVLKTSDSLQIIKLLDYKPFVRVPYEEAKISLEKKLREAALQEKMHQWEAELTKDAKIEIVETPENN